MDELRSLVAAQNEYASVLEERGVPVQLPEPGVFAKAVVDPKYAVAISSWGPTSLFQPHLTFFLRSVTIESLIKRSHPVADEWEGRDEDDDGEDGNESDELVVDVVDDDMNVDEPPYKRRYLLIECGLLRTFWYDTPASMQLTVTPLFFLSKVFKV